MIKLFFDILEAIVVLIELSIFATVLMSWISPEGKGSINEIPTGYVVCDGRNGTPDLRDKFVIGAGATYKSGESGGSLSHTHSGNIDVGVLSTESVEVVNGPPPHRGRHGHHHHPHDHHDGPPIQKINVLSGDGGSHRHSTKIESSEHVPPFYSILFLMKI